MERNIFASYKNSILFAAKKDSWDSCQTSVENLVREIYPTIPKKDIQGTSLFYAVKEHDIDKLTDALNYTENFLFHTDKQKSIAQPEIERGGIAAGRKFYEATFMQHDEFIKRRDDILFNAGAYYLWTAGIEMANLLHDLQPLMRKYDVRVDFMRYEGYEQLVEDLNRLESLVYPMVQPPENISLTIAYKLLEDIKKEMAKFHGNISGIDGYRLQGQYETINTLIEQTEKVLREG